MSEFNDEQFLEELRGDEGFVPYAYQDSLGYWTIGMGTLIDRRKGGGITEDQAKYLARSKVEKIKAELDEKIPWWRTLSPARQHVLANMAYQLGVEGLLRFRKAIRAAQEGDYDHAAREMLDSTWAEQTPNRAKRLAEEMRHG